MSRPSPRWDAFGSQTHQVASPRSQRSLSPVIWESLIGEGEASMTHCVRYRAVHSPFRQFSAPDERGGAEVQRRDPRRWGGIESFQKGAHAASICGAGTQPTAVMFQKLPQSPEPLPPHPPSVLSRPCYSPSHEAEMTTVASVSRSSRKPDGHRYPG